jgi:hypothetical protein
MVNLTRGDLVVESFGRVIIWSWAFLRSGYLAFALIEEVLEPNVLVLEIKLENRKPSFCLNRKKWRMESTGTKSPATK